MMAQAENLLDPNINLINFKLRAKILILYTRVRVRDVFCATRGR